MNTENNRLIAEFMGCSSEKVTLFKDEIDEDGNSLEVTQLKWSRPSFFTEALYKAYGWGSYHNETYMLYASSWDWLMPVVEKIESLNMLIFEGEEVEFSIDIRHNNVWINQHSVAPENEKWDEEDFLDLLTNKPNPRTKLSEVYRAVVKFIQWYNQQNQNENGSK